MDAIAIFHCVRQNFVGMNRRIILWHNRPIQSTDAAGTTILISVSAPPSFHEPGRYASTSPDTPLSYVPPLAYFCINALIRSPELEHVHHFGPPRLLYKAPASPTVSDILRALIPSYDPIPTKDGHLVLKGFDIHEMDPRLWAILVQVFVELPDVLRVYPIALSDKNIPLLQRIPSTSYFTLLTVLDLPGSVHLTDDTILELKALHGLCALDASGTQLTAQAIRRLSGSLTWSEESTDPASKRRGPWQLRILNLRNCRKLGDIVLDHLATFPLLSVVGKSYK